MRCIAVMNQKGGVGKTTTAVHLGHALALAGHRVTVVDLDPQAHLGTCLGGSVEDDHGMDQVLERRATPGAHARQIREGLWLVPAGRDLANVAATITIDKARCAQQLHESLDRDFATHDFVVLDSPPATGLLMVLGILLADEVLIPVSSDYLALKGVAHLVQTIRKFNLSASRQLVQTIVMTRFHRRRRLCAEVMQQLLRYFPDQVLATPIREAVALAQRASFGQTVFDFDRGSNAASDYRSLTTDYLERRTM